MSRITIACLISLVVSAASAQTADAPELEACRATGLIAIQERSPAVKDIIFDVETLAISKTNTKVEDTPIRTIVMGDAYFERKEIGKSRRFLCLVGEKGKVLLTFFTAQ